MTLLAHTYVDDTTGMRLSRVRTLALAGIIAVGFFAIDEGTPLHEWAGLLQRVLCAVWFACLIALGVRLRAVSSTSSRQQAISR